MLALSRKSPLRGLPRRERDGVAELLQPPHVMPLQPRRVEAVEVVRAEVPIGLAVPQDVVDAAEQAVRHGDDGLLAPPTAGEAVEERVQVGALAARRRPGDLAEHPAQPAVALRRLGAEALAATLLVARADPHPRGEMLGAREAGHVVADLRD